MYNRMVHNKQDMTISGLICNLKPLSLMVTLYTNRFNLKKNLFSAHTVYFCFVCISQKTAIISLYSPNCSFLQPKQCMFTTWYKLNL